MSITSGHLTGPERSDLLPVGEVEALIATADRELSALEREAAAATAAADAMQQRVIDEGADKRSSTWAMMQLRRFLDGLNDEVDREVHALVDVAERWSRQRVEEARTEAESVRARHHSKAHAAPQLDTAQGPLSWLSDSSSRLAAPAPVTVETKAPAVEPTKITGTAVPLRPPAVNGTAKVPSPITADPSEAPPALPDPDPRANEVAQPRDTGTLPVPPAPLPPVAETGGIVDPLAADADPAPASGASPDDPFWVAPPAPKRSKRVRRIPWTAVLQVLAVVAIFVFILLRLG